MHSPEPIPAQPLPGSLAGLGIALLVVGAWGVSLLLGLRVALEPNLLSVVLVLALFAARTFFNVGLFITAHDAMHGLVAPARPRLNRGIGQVALWLYAGLRYDELRKHHMAHHASPGRADDPDSHTDPRFAPWFLAFVRRYVHTTTVGWNACIVCILVLVGVPPLNVGLFFVLPAWLSVVQLFTFGTWAPHRPTAEPFVDDHRARSTRVAPLWSFLSCYHFGYHWEHHEFPWVPWWRLPAARRISSTDASARLGAPAAS